MKKSVSQSQLLNMLSPRATPKVTKIEIANFIRLLINIASFFFVFFLFFFLIFELCLFFD